MQKDSYYLLLESECGSGNGCVIDNIFRAAGSHEMRLIPPGARLNGVLSSHYFIAHGLTTMD